jgi:hypothetical protein
MGTSVSEKSESELSGKLSNVTILAKFPNQNDWKSSQNDCLFKNFLVGTPNLKFGWHPSKVKFAPDKAHRNYL